MDWSSVYDDNVEELGRWDDKVVRYDLRARTTILATFTTDQFTPLICYLFTVNYILGVGCLGVPYAFLEAGLVLGTLTIFICSASSFVTVMWVAECGNRLFQRKIAEKGNAFQSPKLSRRVPDSLPQATSEVQALLTRAASSMGDIASLVGGATAVSTTTTATGGEEQEDWKHRRRGGKQKEKRGKDDLHEPELTEICEFYLGRQYSVFVYQGSLMALAYVGLLAYSQVFVQGMISFAFPQADDVSTATLLLVLLLFSVVVIPLSLHDLNEQVSVQVAMSLLRFLSLGILLVACVYGLFADPNYTVPCEEEEAALQMAPFQTPWFNTAGFGLAFTTSVFSQLFQHSVPGLVRPLAAEHRKHVPQIFGSALLTTGLIYVGLGCSAVMFFGNKTKESVNLNMSCYFFGVSQNSSWLPVASFLSNVVLLFPALDTLSVYPLIANTLGGNLHASFPHLLDPITSSLWAETETETQDRAAELKRLTLSGFRCLAAIPPILCSLLVTDLTVSLNLAGMAGIIVALVTPCLLRLALAQEETPPSSSSSSSSSFFPWILEDTRLPYAGLAMAGTALIVCAWQLILA